MLSLFGEDGTHTVVSGSVFDETSPAPACMISSELALFNGLNVGDTIALSAQTAFTYVLGSAGNYETFKAAVEVEGLPENYTLSSSDLASYSGSKANVLNHVNYEFESGKIYAIVGKSGAGKTTLLSVLSSLAAPTEGRILVGGKDISEIDKYEFRSSLVGVVFQSFNLLPHLTAVENVMLSMDISGRDIPDKKTRARELLARVRIDGEDMDRRVLKLSGGQQQRVAIARALSYDPEIILADEPTGNLDLETQKEIMDIFRGLAGEGKCVIIVTHSPDVARAADVTYELTKGMAAVG